MSILSEKQTAFLRALAQGAVPSEAYRIGFGHPKMRPWMRQSAHVLMKSAKLAPFVETARSEYRQRLEAATVAAAAEQAAKEAALFAELGVSQEQVVRALAAIAFADPAQARVQDKLTALGMLARMLGLFERAKDKVSESSPLNLTITIDGEEQTAAGKPRSLSPGAAQLPSAATGAA